MPKIAIKHFSYLYTGDKPYICPRTSPNRKQKSIYDNTTSKWPYSNIYFLMNISVSFSYFTETCIVMYLCYWFFQMFYFHLLTRILKWKKILSNKLQEIRITVLSWSRYKLLHLLIWPAVQGNFYHTRHFWY